MSRKAPMKFTDARKARAVEAAEAGGTQGQAAAVAGVSVRTLSSHLASDEEFRDAYEGAQMKAHAASLSVIRSSTDWRAHAWYLERVDPENYGKHNVEQRLAAELAKFGEQKTWTEADARARLGDDVVDLAKERAVRGGTLPTLPRATREDIG